MSAQIELGSVLLVKATESWTEEGGADKSRRATEQMHDAAAREVLLETEGALRDL